MSASTAQGKGGCLNFCIFVLWIFRSLIEFLGSGRCAPELKAQWPLLVDGWSLHGRSGARSSCCDRWGTFRSWRVCASLPAGCLLCHGAALMGGAHSSAELCCFFFPCMHWLEGDCGVQLAYSKQLGHCGAAQPQLVTAMSLTAESIPSASLGSRTCSGCGCVGCGGDRVQHLVLWPVMLLWFHFFSSSHALCSYECLCDQEERCRWWVCWSSWWAWKRCCGPAARARDSCTVMNCSPRTPVPDLHQDWVYKMSGLQDGVLLFRLEVRGKAGARVCSPCLLSRVWLLSYHRVVSSQLLLPALLFITLHRTSPVWADESRVWVLN